MRSFMSLRFRRQGGHYFSFRVRVPVPPVSATAVPPHSRPPLILSTSKLSKIAPDCLLLPLSAFGYNSPIIDANPSRNGPRFRSCGWLWELVHLLAAMMKKLSVVGCRTPGPSTVAAFATLALIAFVFASQIAVASDITTRGGVKYRDSVVIKVETDGVRLKHRDGVAFVAFDDLPKDVQAKYGWTAEKSAALKAEHKAAENHSPAPPPAIPKQEPEHRPEIEAPMRGELKSTRAATPTPVERAQKLQAVEPVRTQSESPRSRTNEPQRAAEPVLGLWVKLVGIAFPTVVIVGVVFLLRRRFQKPGPPSMAEERVIRAGPPPMAKPVPVQRSTGREPEISIRVSFSDDTPAERNMGRGEAKLTWYSAGQSVSHSGVRIGSGMLYTTERALRWPGEPSAIITSLSVARTGALPSQDFGYYPSYESLTPDQRRCYLEWLSAGRQDADPSQRSLGYVFMFFYGLERRILVEGDLDPALLDEILRLLEHYGPAQKSRSLKSYALQLLHFTGWQLGADYYRALWPRLLEFDGERPDQDGMRFVLANLHQRGEPLDWTVAYRIALGNEESRRSTVVTRARDKFWELFEQRFSERFPGGIVLQAGKQQALVQYRPASSALMQMSYERKRGNPFELRLPNVAGLHRQFKALPEIWNSCVDDLSGYSRALGSKKHGQAAALAAWEALPPDLRRAEEHPAKPAFDELVTTASREGDYIFTPVGVLAALAGIDERAKLTAGQSRQVAELVSGLGWQLAPNPEVTGLPLAWNQELALYPAIPGEAVEPHVSGLVRLLYLAITLAAADGVIEPEELDSFHQLIAPQIQRESDWRPLRATEASLRRDANVALRSLPQMAKIIPKESRLFVLRTMAHIAAADNEVTLDELKILRRMARAFDLDADAVEKLLREDEAFREVTIEGGRGKQSGETIPVRPTEQPAAFALDHDRIKALTQETHEVISMLSVVMAEPDEAPVAAPVSVATAPVEMSAPIAWLTGLDARYHSAVLTLVRHDELTTADFDALAAKHHLMPDDLLNAVNTWSDETLGDFLLERGENLRIFRALLPDTAELPIAA